MVEMEAIGGQPEKPRAKLLFTDQEPIVYIVIPIVMLVVLLVIRLLQV